MKLPFGSSVVLAPALNRCVCSDTVQAGSKAKASREDTAIRPVPFLPLAFILEMHTSSEARGCNPVGERFTTAPSTPICAQTRDGPTKLAAAFPPHPRSRGFRRRSLRGKSLHHGDGQAPSLQGSPVYPAPGRLLPPRPERSGPRGPQRGGAARPGLPACRPPGPARPGVQAAETKERAGAAPPLQPPAPRARTPTAIATPPQPRPVGSAGGRGA